MDHQYEDLMRGAKAYRLCLAFERLCRRKRHMSKKGMVPAAERLPLEAWEELAKQEGLRMPSTATVACAIGILRARAGL